MKFASATAAVIAMPLSAAYMKLPDPMSFTSPSGGAIHVPKRRKLKRRLKTIKGRRK